MAELDKLTHRLNYLNELTCGINQVGLPYASGYFKAISAFCHLHVGIKSNMFQVFLIKFKIFILFFIRLNCK